MAVFALCVVISFVTPVAAHAQQIAPTKDAQDTINEDAEYVVVSSGDSLWTIISERLGPNATPQQVVKGVERIYALNRNQIGDPDLIYPGQKVLLPPTVQPSTTKLAARAKPARKATKPAKVSSAKTSQTDRAAESSETDRTSRPIVGEDNSKNDPAPEPETESATLPTLPDEVASANVPTVRPLVSNESPSSLAEARADQYRMLGLMIFLLTVTGIVSILGVGAFRWAVRRKERMPELRFKEKFGNNYSAYGPFESHKDTSRFASKVCGSTVPSSDSRNGGIMQKNYSADGGLLAIARAKRERIRREHELGLERPSRQYPEPDIQGPNISSPLRGLPSSWSQKRLLYRRRRMATVMVVAAAKGSHHPLHEEWEPSVALRNALEKMPLQPGAGHLGYTARLKPHLEEAVKTLTRIERRRGLSDRERLREQALRILLESLKEVE